MDEEPKATGGGISRRGFASMDPERRAEIARKGGRSVPATARSFSQNPELAAAAGSRGGKAKAKRKPA